MRLMGKLASVIALITIQAPPHLPAQLTRNCLSKNVLSLLSETTTIKTDTPNQWPTDISFLCVDLKYTGQLIKICEFGGMLASTRRTQVSMSGKNETLIAPYWEVFWHYLAQFKKPIWYVGRQQKDILRELACVQGKNFKTLTSFLKDFQKNVAQSKKTEELSPKKIQDHTGVLVINDRIKSSTIKELMINFPSLLIVNANTKIFTKKEHSFDLFNNNKDIKSFAPGWKEYKKKYNSKLAQTIINDIPANYYIIKPQDAVHSNGVLMVAKENLDDYLQYILNKNDKLKTPYDENLLYWQKDHHESFYVQEYVSSKDFIYQGKRYDPTMRLFFFLSHDQGTITIDVIAGYWKIPLKSLDEKGTLMEKHISHSLLGHSFTGILVDEQDLTHVKQLMAAMLPSLYPRMLQYVHDQSV